MNSRNIIQNVLDYIDENIKSEISNDDLCSIAGYSYIHLARLFKQYLGISPNEYILKRRLLFAVYEMNGDLSKTDIAFEFGFDTYAGFYKAFMRELSCSPSKFTKSYVGGKPYKINILQEENIMVSKTKIQKILPNWNLQNSVVKPIINENTGKQSDNSYYIGDGYVMKYSTNFAVIKKSTLFSEVLKLNNGDDYLQYGELYFIVTKRIYGNQLKCVDIFNDTSIALTIGENIAKLHNKLKFFDIDNFEQANIYDDCINNLNKVQKVANLSNKLCEKYKNEFGKLINKLPTQLIHRDINPSNMIFDEKEFKGFVDFDLTEVNVRIFDICYCATAILSECFNNQINFKLWQKILNNLIKGYNRIDKLSEHEIEAIPYVIYSIEIICIAYFSKYDKFEELTERNISMLKWLIENM
ncbi:helix-turn-helix domain-containing protein [uncultured Eubacterium sp.]|uniref:helix-turn-helix domain-containing protein n=1 Tax=uncultured Eubacterium sp. TaxID=165185 RepID=UPI0025F058C6|nr:helix-turn-helix domain-containing protein [uncultured Eubacterium sp.]